MAKATNTDKILIGSENVTSNNYAIFLNKNESVQIEIEDLSKVFVIANVNGEGVNFNYGN